MHRSLALSILCFVAMLVGLMFIATACVGVYELRTVAAADFDGDMADYTVVGSAWELFDAGQPPAKPAFIAARVQKLFLACGFVGVVLLVVSGGAFLASSTHVQA